MSDKKPSDATPEQLARLLAEGADRAQAAEPSPLTVGQRIDDFEILEEVGRGGMGVVYRAFEVPLKRVVALKVLNREISSNVSALRRFRREATLAANLVHPNLIAVYHLSTHENPLYFTMEFVQGRSVRDKVEQSGFLQPAEAVRIILQVCDALQYAHEHDIIHRDIKPSNILLQNHMERVRITDFGIAQDLSGTLADLTRTEGITAGTLAFMSPEQNRGEAIDRRSDVYSLGMTLYYMLTGKVAYAARNRAELAEMFRDVSPQPPSRFNPDVTPALDRVVMKMIAVERSRRYTDCTSAVAGLNAAMAGGAAKAHRRVAGFGGRPVWRRIAAAVAAVAVLAAVYVVARLLWTVPPRGGQTSGGGPAAQVVLQDDFNGNRNWAFNGDFAHPNFAEYPGVKGWVNGPLSGERRPDTHYFVNIADGMISGCGQGYGKEAESFVPAIHREIDLDASRGFSLEFRAVSAADWPNAVAVYLLTDWKEGAKKVKYYTFRIYGESSNHTIDLHSTALDSLSDCLYRYKAGPLVNQTHTYTFIHPPDGTFELRIDGEKVQAFQPPRDRAYNRFNRIGVDVMRKGSKIDWIRLAPLNLEPVSAPPTEGPARLLPGTKTCKGRICTGDEGGGEVKNPEGGWDGKFDTCTEAHSNGNRLIGITWETTESHFIARDARNVRLHAKVEHSHWQSHANVYVYNFATDEYEPKMGGEGAPDGVEEKTVPLKADNVRNGEVRVRALLFAKHSGQAYARYYESEILYDGKEAAAPKPPTGGFSGFADWQNRPIPKNMVDSEGRGKNHMPEFVDGSVRGVGTGYNFVNPWMVRAADLKDARAVYVTIKGKSGPSLMNQAGVWLLDRSWEGDMKPAVGYQILVYGEGAKRISVYRYAKDGSSIEVARFGVGAEIHNIHTYVVSRDGSGNWSATMDAAPLPRGQKDEGSPDLTFRDMTYTDFAFTGIHFNSQESQLDSVRFERD